MKFDSVELAFAKLQQLLLYIYENFAVIKKFDIVSLYDLFLSIKFIANFSATSKISHGI